MTTCCLFRGVLWHASLLTYVWVQKGKKVKLATAIGEELTEREVGVQERSCSSLLFAMDGLWSSEKGSVNVGTRTAMA